MRHVFLFKETLISCSHSPQLVHQLQLELVLVSAENERIKAETEVLRANQPRRKLGAPTPELARLKDKIEKAGCKYSFLYSPWINQGVLDYSVRPDVDPTNWAWRYPAGPRSRVLEKERREVAQAAELLDFLQEEFPQVRAKWDNEWVKTTVSLRSAPLFACTPADLAYFGSSTMHLSLRGQDLSTLRRRSVQKSTATTHNLQMSTGVATRRSFRTTPTSSCTVVMLCLSLVLL